MENSDFLRCSFTATIAYGLTALVGLLIAGLVLGSEASVFLALLALGCAYVSQQLTGWAVALADDRFSLAAIVLQVLACAAFLVGLFKL